MKQKIKLHTVNVIETVNDEFQAIWSFADNPVGNKQAERFFCHKIREYEKENAIILCNKMGRFLPSDKEDFENYIEDGIYDILDAYKLLLVHSI